MEQFRYVLLLNTKTRQKLELPLQKPAHHIQKRYQKEVLIIYHPLLASFHLWCPFLPTSSPKFRRNSLNLILTAGHTPQKLILNSIDVIEGQPPVRAALVLENRQTAGFSHLFFRFGRAAEPRSVQEHCVSCTKEGSDQLFRKRCVLLLQFVNSFFHFLSFPWVPVEVRKHGRRDQPTQGRFAASPLFPPQTPHKAEVLDFAGIGLELLANQTTRGRDFAVMGRG
jgi:hypothetical protein